jgi:hypothetical protein
MKRPKYPKSRDTSYMSAVFNDYENLMNRVDENVNKIDENVNNYFHLPHNNEILYQHKPFNEEKDYTQKIVFYLYLHKKEKMQERKRRRNFIRYYRKRRKRKSTFIQRRNIKSF